MKCHLPGGLTGDSEPGIFVGGQGTRAPSAQHVPEFQGPGRKAGVRHEPRCWPKQLRPRVTLITEGTVATVPKSKFPDTRQGSVWPAGPSKDTVSGLLCLLSSAQEKTLQTSPPGSSSREDSIRWMICHVHAQDIPNPTVPKGSFECGAGLFSLTTTTGRMDPGSNPVSATPCCCDLGLSFFFFKMGTGICSPSSPLPFPPLSINYWGEELQDPLQTVKGFQRET